MSGVPSGVSIRAGTWISADAESRIEDLEAGHVADASVSTAELADAAVTLAKMANLAQDKFIVRTTASTGVPEVATCTAFGRALVAKTAAVAITGDYSDGTVLASVVAALVSLGLCTDGTTP